MINHSLLSEVFARGYENGVGSLSKHERELFQIQEFILAFEIDGLAGYFYNCLPELNRVRSAIISMQSQNLAELANLLSEAADLFSSYAEPDPPMTWETVCKQYDPTGRLDELQNSIDSLDDLGIPPT